MRNPILGILICFVVFACGKSPDESTAVPTPSPEIAPSLAQRSVEAVADEFLLAYIDSEIINLRKGLELGYSAPRLTVVDVPAAYRKSH